MISDLACFENRFQNVRIGSWIRNGWGKIRWEVYSPFLRIRTLGIGQQGCSERSLSSFVRCECGSTGRSLTHWYFIVSRAIISNPSTTTISPCKMVLVDVGFLLSRVITYWAIWSNGKICIKGAGWVGFISAKYSRLATRRWDHPHSKNPLDLHCRPAGVPTSLVENIKFLRFVMSRWRSGVVMTMGKIELKSGKKTFTDRSISPVVRFNATANFASSLRIFLGEM